MDGVSAGDVVRRYFPARAPDPKEMRGGLPASGGWLNFTSKICVRDGSKPARNWVQSALSQER